MNIIFRFICLLMILVQTSCIKSRHDKVDEYFNRIDSLLQVQNVELAKRLVDTIHIKFSSDFTARKQALITNYRIEIIENKRNIIFYDSLKIEKESYRDSLLQFFNIETDTLYRKQHIYTHKKQSVVTNTSRLKIDVTSNGEITFSAIYRGLNPIEFSRIVVESNGVFNESMEYDLIKHKKHLFKDEKDYFEIVNLTENDASIIIGFVEQFINQPIKLTMHGKAKNSFYISNQDKQALVETWRLALLLKDIDKIEKQTTIARSKINLLQQKLEN